MCQRKSQAPFQLTMLQPPKTMLVATHQMMSQLFTFVGRKDVRRHVLVKYLSTKAVTPVNKGREQTQTLKKSSRREKDCGLKNKKITFKTVRGTKED